MIAKAQAIECWKCNPTVRSATESHWRIYPVKHVGRNSWLVCADCAEWSKDEDDHDIGSFTVLYLPIVRPDVGSEQAIAMDVAMHVVCRLLRMQADITAAERDEAEETLALLRATQAEAGRRAMEARI